MSAWRYWRQVLGRTVHKTFSHALRKILLGLVISITAFVLQWYLFNLRNWTDTQKLIFSLLGAAVIVLVGSFLVNVFLAPAELHNNTLECLRSTETALGEEADRLRRECADLRTEVKMHIEKQVVPKVILVYALAQRGGFELVERGGADATNVTVSPMVNGPKRICFGAVDRVYANDKHGLYFWQQDSNNADVAISPFNSPGNPVHRALDWLCSETASFEKPIFAARLEVSFDGNEGRDHHKGAFELQYDGVTKELSLLPKA